MSVVAFQFWSDKGLQYDIVSDGKTKKNKGMGRKHP